MDLKDAKRAFIIYLNFIKINKEIRKMASTIIVEFNIKLKIHFYEVDNKVAEGLKLAIEVKEKEKSTLRPSESPEPMTRISPPNLRRDIVEKVEFMTDSKHRKGSQNFAIEL
jgi:hypothetical protein